MTGSDTWALVFTGHMIDAPGRAEPRFPPRAEPLAGEAITTAVRAQIERHGRLEPIIAGGACGGDIIFHEVCRALGLETEVLLALPPEEFRVTSVAFAGPDWERRYDRLLAETEARVLDARPHPTVWEQSNRWMLDEARSRAGGFTLIALWNGMGGDGSGGTEHLVQLAIAAGGDVDLIDATALFGI